MSIFSGTSMSERHEGKRVVMAEVLRLRQSIRKRMDRLRSG